MMSKSRSSKIAMLKQIALIPVMAGIVFLFSTKVMAQDTEQQEKSIKSTMEGVSQDVLNEYKNIINTYKTDKKWWRGLRQKITASDRERLETIFKQMSKEQQAKQCVAFMPSPPPLPKIVPTEEQLETWKNPKIYGLWINGERVNNAILSEYSNTDFAQVFISKLEKNAINYGKHYYQIDLMTKEYYQNYYDQAIANKRNMLVIRRF